MNISIDEFEQIIDETILKRGLLYFEKGYVKIRKFYNMTKNLLDLLT